MSLNTFKESITTALSTALTGWTVQTDTIAFAQDKLVEVIWLDASFEMIEMSQLALKGNLGIVLYREYGESYDTMVDAIETIAELLPTLNISDAAIGNQTATLANVSSPSGVTDGRTTFRTVTMTVPVEVIL